MDKIIQLVTALFTLSLINERIAEFFKVWLSCRKIGKTFIVGDTLTKFPINSYHEQRRHYRILKLNLTIGFLTSFACHASFFDLIHQMGDPGKVLFWPDLKTMNITVDPAYILPNLYFLLGCFFTASFISMGSKFWHDLLDILMAIKDRKKGLDATTYQTNAEPTELWMTACNAAKTALLATKGVTATSLQTDANGYYLDVTIQNSAVPIPDSFVYKPDGEQEIPIRIVKHIDAQNIIAHSINLSDTIFNAKSTTNQGTLGCLVNKKGKKDTLVLTCFHNVVEPGSSFTFHDTDKNDVTLQDAKTTIAGKTIEGIRDGEIDAALVQIDKKDLPNILNVVSGLGKITGVRESTTTTDVNAGFPVFLNGMTSHFQKGKVTGVYCDVKIHYDGVEHQLTNLISIANDGTAITQGGDSGAAVLDIDNKLVGIIVGGNLSTSYAIKAKIIFSKLQLDLVTS